MGLEILVTQIGEVGQDLCGRQHPFIDDHFRAERTDVEHQRLLQFFAAAQHATGLLANHIKLAFKRIALDPVGCTDEQHFDVRFASEGGRADICRISVLGHIAPSDQGLARLLDQFSDRCLTGFSLRLVGGQEHQSGGKTARFGQIDIQVSLGNFSQKIMRQSTKDSGAVSGIGLTTTGPAVVHVLQDCIGIQYDLMARHTFDLRDKTDAARILFECRIVQALLFGQMN